MSISIAESIRCVGLPIIVTTSEPHLNFLVDTGANFNSIFSFVFEGLPDFFELLGTETTIYGIEGNVVSARQVHAIIGFENTTADTVFTVIDDDTVVDKLQNENGFQLHGIIGSSFLKANKWILDFANLEIIT